MPVNLAPLSASGILVSMRGPPSVLTGLWMPAALGGATGASLAWISEVYAATPIALIGALAIACLGVAVGGLWRPSWRHSPALVAGTLALAIAAPGLGSALPSPPGFSLDAPTWIGMLALFTAGIVSGMTTAGFRGVATTGAWWTAAVTVLVGMQWPGATALAASLLVVAHQRLDTPLRDTHDWRPLLGFSGVLGWGVAIAIAVGGWNALRSSLDPTPQGTAIAWALGLALVGTGAVTRRLLNRAGPAPRSLWAVAGASLLLLFWLGAWPERSWQALSVVAGKSDPRPVLWALLATGIAPGALAAGWVLGPYRSTTVSRSALWAATAAGLIVGLDAGPDLRVQLIGLALLTGMAELWRKSSLGKLRGTGLIGGALAILLLPTPWPEARLSEGRLVHLQDARGPGRHTARVTASTPVAAGWGPGGGMVLLQRPDDGLLQIIEGLPLENEGRAADAERMSSHLARALAPRFDRALVLGDRLGLVTAGLSHDLVERITVAVPHAEALQAAARVNEGLAAAFLHPSVTLVRGGNEQVLRRTAEQDIVVEVARTPWQDGSQGLPGQRQLQARREVLEARQGFYLLVATITRTDAKAFRGLLDDMLSVFPNTWAFLPPSGADQVLLAGWVGEARTNWDQFLAVETIAQSQLSAIGLGSALDLADRALVGPEGLRALAQGGHSPSRRGLPPDLHDGPYLVMELLEPHLEGPEAWLDVGPMTSVATLLEERVANKRAFLRLLSSAVRGDREGVFRESRQLLATEDGAATLDPLLAPQLERARELLQEARVAGLGSRKWSQALSELEAARLMNPRSTTVLALLADTHLHLGNVPKAEELYGVVLQLDPGHLQALLGRAQAALVMKQFKEAEGYLREASERNVRSWVAHHNIGEFLANAHRYTEAERHLKLAIDLSAGKQAAPYAALSTVYLERGETAASLLQANTALALEDRAEHRYLVARAHLELGNISIALTHAQKGALRDSKHPGCLFIIGLIQGRRNQAEQCARTFKQVLELRPGNEPALQNLRRCQQAVEEKRAE